MQIKLVTYQGAFPQPAAFGRGVHKVDGSLVRLTDPADTHFYFDVPDDEQDERFWTVTAADTCTTIGPAAIAAIKQQDIDDKTAEIDDRNDARNKLQATKNMISVFRNGNATNAQMQTAIARILRHITAR